MATTTFEQQLDEIKSAGKSRDYARAASLCTDLLSQTDQFPEALLFLGRSYHALKQHDRAVHAFQFYLKRKPDSPIGLFFLGRTYAALGFYKKAIQSLKRVLEKDPTFAPALSFLGLASLKLKRPDQAVVYFERALKAEPRNRRIHAAYLNALLVQGIRLFYRKELEDAARVFEFLAGENRDNIVPFVYLAVIARELGNFPAALRYYDEALRISPDDAVFHMHKADILIQLGQADAGLAELKQAKGLEKEDLAAAGDPKRLLKMIAVSHFRNKRFREAIYFGKQVLKNDYRDIEMHLLLAECYRGYGDLVKAKNHYLRAAEADKARTGRGDPRSEIFSGLAVVLWERGDYGELLALTRRRLRAEPDDELAAYFQALALSEVDGAAEDLVPMLQDEIRRHGPDPELMYSLARAYADRDRYDLAESWLLRTLALIRNHEASLLLLDEAYEALAKPDEQIRALKAYCVFFPDQIEYLKKYVRLLLQEARYEAATAGLEKLLTREPGNRSLRKALGLVHIKNRRYADGFLVWKELLTREPTSVYYLRQLIFCLVKMRQFSMAIQILDKAARYMKKEVSVLLPLGVLYARTKQFEQANETFRRIIGLNSRDWRAYHNLAMLARRTGNRPLAENFLERARQYRAAAAAVKKKPAPKKPGQK